MNSKNLVVYLDSYGQFDWDRDDQLNNYIDTMDSDLLNAYHDRDEDRIMGQVYEILTFLESRFISKHLIFATKFEAYYGKEFAMITNDILAKFATKAILGVS